MALAALLAAVGLAWVVLVALRPVPTAGLDEVDSSVEASVAEVLRADRLASVAGWMSTAAATFVVGGVIYRAFVSRASRAGREVSLGAVWCGVGAELVSLPLRAAAVSGVGLSGVGDPEVLHFVIEGQFGDKALLRITGLVMVAGFYRAGDVGSAANGRSGGPSWWGWGLGAVGGVLILLSFGLVGHPQASEPGHLFVGAQMVHLVVVSTWFGGVALLAIELWQKPRAPTRYLASVVGRFSTVAGVSVALAMGTGLVLASTVLDSPAELLSSPYGRALLVKLVVLSVPLALGAYNHKRVVPAVMDLDDVAAWRRLRSTASAEAVLLVCGVLLATAAMTSGGF